MKPKAVFIGNEDKNFINRVYRKQMVDRIREQVDLYDPVIHCGNMEDHKDALKDVEVAFSTWGMPVFSEQQIQFYFPSLKAVFYAAGSVQEFARPFIHSGVKVVSAWAANAVSVAEYAAAQIILANKGFFQGTGKTKRDYTNGWDYCRNFPGNYDTNVGILGAGMIGTKVIEFLKPYYLNIKVFDPFLSRERAAELGVTQCSLDEIFSSCQTISNHLADKPETTGILHKHHFDRMLPNATFINTGRGAQVVEKDLIEALKEAPGRTAVLDVTYPEPPDKDSELLTLDNVILTPHIAGCMSDEVQRLAEYMLEELIRFKAGEKLKYEVTLEMLKTMA